MREHTWITRSAWFDARPYPVAYCARCGLRIRRRLNDGRVIRSGERGRMNAVELLPVGPCQPTILHRIGQVVGIALAVAALVGSVVISPVVFAGWLAACVAFGVLQWGWRRLREQV
jgi:hypothetical protein